jgi:hypothetical protein
MKRPLAPEALSHTGHYDDHHPPSLADVAMGQVAKRIREIDPHGDRALALLNEMSTQGEETAAKNNSLFPLDLSKLPDDLSTGTDKIRFEL